MKLDTPRLNPFEFPGNTEFRLIVLIVAVIGASLFIYGDFYYSVIWDKANDFSSGICLLWMIGGSVLTLAVAVGIYWWLPDWKIKREGMRSLEDWKDPELISYLDDLIKEAGLSRIPKLFGVTNNRRDAHAFGRWRKLCVSIPDKVRKRFKENRSVFRGNLLHEFAHIYNGDVHRYYLSVTVGWASLITALPTFVISLLHSPWERGLSMSGRVVVLALLIYLTRNSVLRVREFYADLRASTWDSQSVALWLVCLVHEHELELAKGSAKKLNFWQRIWQRIDLNHPDLGVRQHILENPNPLLQMGFWDAFATGMATMIPFANFVGLGLLTRQTIAPSWRPMLDRFTFFVPALLSAIVIIYVIGSGTWRATFAAVACEKPVRGINKLGTGLALGLVVGQQISFVGASKSLSNPLILLFWGGLLVISLTAFFQWMAASAKEWLPIATTSQSPRIFYRWGIAIAGGIFANLFLSMFMTFIAWNNQSSAHLVIAFSPFISLALIGLWAYPMSSWFWRKRIEQLPVSVWLFLDSPSQPIILSQQVQLKPTLPLIFGLVGGLVGYSLVFIGVALDGNILKFIFPLSICIQVLVAGFVAAWMRHLGSIQGLFSASVAACIISSSVFTHTNLNLTDALFIVTGLFNSGGLVAVPTVLIASVIVSLFRNNKKFRVKGVVH